jgi:CMP-N-acetylneuraminic acid synthetase
MNIVALIPARGGSKRIPRKNIKLLGGKPLIQWTIEAAQQGHLFSDILVPTDDKETTDIVYRLGAKAAYRPNSSDAEPDIVWVHAVLHYIVADAIAILRPTSPFRDADTIRAAVQRFNDWQPADSLRFVRRVNEHPGKMWSVQRGERMTPILPLWTRTGNDSTDTPWHSAPTQTLPMFYVQTAGMEIVWTKVVRETNTISGATVIPFEVSGWPALDINTPEDWDRAERHVADLQAAASTQ